MMTRIHLGLLQLYLLSLSALKLLKQKNWLYLEEYMSTCALFGSSF